MAMEVVHVATVAMAVAKVAMAVDGEIDGEVEVDETVVVVMEAVTMEVAMEVEAVAVVMEVEVVALKVEAVETVAMEVEAAAMEPWRGRRLRHRTRDAYDYIPQKETRPVHSQLVL